MKLLFENWRKYIKQEVESFLPHGTVRDVNMIGSSVLSPEEQEQQDIEKYGDVQSERDIDVEVQIAGITPEETVKWAFSDEAQRLEDEENYDVQLRIVENWRNFVDEQLLAESRYTDAHDFAQNIKKMAQRAKLTDLYNRMSEEDISKLKSAMQYAINYLSEADPTGNNKYTMWAARNLRATLARRLQVLLGGVVQNWDKPVDNGDKTNAEHYANLVRQDAAKLSSVLKRWNESESD